MRRTGLAILVLLALAGVGAADDGLVAEWHFDEGSGSVLYDSSGNGNDGAIYGATWVEGKFGRALEFDRDVGTYLNATTLSRCNAST